MKKALISRKLVKAAIALIIILYLLLKTTSPKIIFAPFLVCCVASIGKNLGMLFNHAKVALFFDWLFKVVFFLSWFTFLIAACCFAIKDENYKVIFFTLPFWLGGLIFLRRKLFHKKR